MSAASFAESPPGAIYQELALVRNGSEVHVVDVEVNMGPKGVKLAESAIVCDATTLLDFPVDSPGCAFSDGNRLAGLSWSRDGSKLAWFKLDPRRMPGTNHKASVVVADLAREQCRDIGRVAFRVLRDAASETYACLLGPPQWSQDGSWLLVTDADGVTRFHPGGDSERLVEQEDTLPALLAPDGHSFVFARRKSLFLAGVGGLDLLDVRQVSDSFEDAARDDILAYAYSPEGTRLAVSSGRHLIMLDMETLQAERIHRAGREIGQIRWSPQGDALLIVSGSKGLVTGGVRSTPLPSATRGISRWTFVGADGTNDRKCFEISPLDVRDAWFDVSQDGRLVVTTCGHPLRPDSRNLVIAGLDVCREIHVKRSRDCSYPVWRPR